MGATSGMGRCTADLFSRGGCQNCRLRPSRTAGRNPYGSFGTNRCHFIKADVTREADVKGVIDVCVTKWGRMDCLFNNAGASTVGNGIEMISVEDFDCVINSVLSDVRHEAHSGDYDGAIIGQHNQQRQHRRAASWLFELFGIRSGKGGCHSPHSVRRHAAGEHNVRVNNISPGAIPTGIFGKAFGLEADRADTAAGLLWQRSQKRNRFRAGSPDDIAEAAVFLASDHSSFSGLSAGRLWAVQRQSRHAMREALGTGAE